MAQGRSPPCLSRLHLKQDLNAARAGVAEPVGVEHPFAMIFRRLVQIVVDPKGIQPAGCSFLVYQIEHQEFDWASVCHV